jgi:hypothetical protein
MSAGWAIRSVQQDAEREGKVAEIKQMKQESLAEYIKIVLLKLDWAKDNKIPKGRGRKSANLPAFEFVRILEKTSWGKRSTKRGEMVFMPYSDYIDHFTVTLKPPLRLTLQEAAAKWLMDAKTGNGT